MFDFKLIRKNVSDGLLTLWEFLRGGRHRVWVIHTETEAGLFLWKNWEMIFPHIDGLVKIAEEPAFIRSFQGFETENRWLGFGRMKWNEANNKKWTTLYRTPEYEHKKLEFFSTEVWAPDWNHCSKQGRNPALFVQLYQYDFKGLKEGILVAMPMPLVRKKREEIERCVESIQKAIPNSSVSEVARSWQSGGRFNNFMEDITPHELADIIYSRKDME